MSKLFYRFFDSYRVKDDAPTIVHIGRNSIGSIEFYPSDTNPFMDGYGYVRVYDNGELFCDENLAKLILYTDSHKEFMEYCFDIWKNRTNKKIYPKFIILSSGDRSVMDEMRPYLDSSLETHLVP
jgi:hypothetical protein